MGIVYRLIVLLLNIMEKFKEEMLYFTVSSPSHPLWMEVEERLILDFRFLCEENIGSCVNRSSYIIV